MPDDRHSIETVLLRIRERYGQDLEKKPSRDCDKCGEPMAYLARLPALSTGPAANLFRCDGCDLVVRETVDPIKGDR